MIIHKSSITNNVDISRIEHFKITSGYNLLLSDSEAHSMYICPKARFKKEEWFNQASANSAALYKGVRGKTIGCFTMRTKRTFFITKNYLLK